MNPIPYNFLLLLFTFGSFILFNGCKSDFEASSVDFLIEEKTFLSSEVKPNNASDIFTIKKGLGIKFHTTLEAFEISGDKLWYVNNEKQGEGDSFIYPFPNDGLYAVKLCITKEDNEKCVTKWVSVGNLPPAVLADEELLPVIQILNPQKEKLEVSSSTDSYEIKAKFLNVEKNNITFWVNGTKTLFAFDSSSGLLNENIKLGREKTKIKLIASNEKGNSDQVEILIVKKKAVNIEGLPGNNPPIRKVEVQIKEPTESNVTEKSQTVTISSRNLPQGEAPVLKHNGKEVQLIYDNNEEVWEGSIDLVDGRNELLASAQNVQDSKTINLETEPQPQNNSPLAPGTNAGYIATTRSISCSVEAGGEHDFTMTPNINITPLEMVVFSDRCGLASIQIQGGGEKYIFQSVLNPEKTQILFSDNFITLEAGTTYRFTLVASKGGNCSAAKAPEFLDASSCSPQINSNPDISFNHGGKAIIFDFKYLK